MTPSKNILVVDDQEQVLYVWQCALRKFNSKVQVETAQNGPDALDILARRPMDLVITDFRMPGMNGDELTKVIRTRYPGLKVFWITAFRTPQMEALAGDLDVPACLDKPMSIAQIRQMMEKELNFMGDAFPSQ